MFFLYEQKQWWELRLQACISSNKKDCFTYIKMCLLRVKASTFSFFVCPSDRKMKNQWILFVYSFFVLPLNVWVCAWLRTCDSDSCRRRRHFRFLFFTKKPLFIQLFIMLLESVFRKHRLSSASSVSKPNNSATYAFLQ